MKLSTMLTGTEPTLMLKEMKGTDACANITEAALSRRAPAWGDGVVWGGSPIRTGAVRLTPDRYRSTTFEFGSSHWMRGAFRSVMKRSLQLLIVAAMCGLAMAASQSSKIAPDLTGLPKQQTVDAIVQYTHYPNSDDWNQAESSGSVNRAYQHINAIRMTASVTMLELMALNPNVAYISPNRTTFKTLDITTASVNATLVWNSGYDGSGVGVAVIDSGIFANHDDLQGATGSRVVYSQSFLPGLDASDQFGHGTHVAGIIGSTGHDSSGSAFSRTFRGVASNVNLINLRVLDANGSGTDDGVIAAIDQAITLKSTYNIRVINLSLGRPIFESYTLDPLCQAVEAAWQAGIVVVAAAGNYGRTNSNGTLGYATIVAPGNDPYVITVGAMNTMGTKPITDDKIASYSSKGPTAIDHIVKPDVVAPGNGVVSLMAPNSTLPDTYPQTLVNDSYYESGVSGESTTYLKLSGTSMATPVVSGAAALMIQKDPTLTPDTVKARLMKTARKTFQLYTTSYDAFTQLAYSSQSDIFTVGAGYVDVQGALASTDRVGSWALSPMVVYNPATNTVTMVDTPGEIWGNDLIWGDTLVYGSYVLNGTLNGADLIWGDSTVWGNSATTAFDLIWGDSILASGTIQGLESGDDDGNQ